MARSAYTKDNFPSDAEPSTLDSDISAGATAFNISPATNWSSSNLWASIGRRTAKEELVYIETNSSGALTNVDRGQGGTTAQAHSAGDAIEVVGPGVALGEMSKAVNETVGAVTAQGDILVASAANTLARLAKGTSGLPLVAGASTVSYAALGAAGLAAKAVTTAKIDDNAVDKVKVDDTSFIPTTVVYTSNDTWTKADYAEMKWVRVIAVGGGGGGGGASGNESSPGGGGGGYAESIVAAASLGATETVTVGAGGAGGVGAADGAAGGTSSFGAHAAASGGSGGQRSTFYKGGAAGAGTTGDILVNGDAGGSAAGAGGATGANGGGTPLGGGGLGSGAGNLDGGPGRIYGGGGGGGNRNDASTSNGGAGAAGVVIVEVHYI